MLNYFFAAIMAVLLASTPLSSSEISWDSSLYGDSALLPDVFMRRHSGTEYNLQPLTEDHMQALVQSARWTPSSYNDQPWNFIFCDRYSTPEAYFKVVDSIYGQEWVEEAPLLVIVVVRSNFLYNGKKNDWAEYDTGAAAYGMSLAATEMGLMAHQIGGFDPEQIKEEFAIPEGFTPLALIAIGYESDSASESERIRRPVTENFFKGDWGHPIDE